MRLSIIIPAFNEKKTISETLKRIEAVNLEGIEKEIIIVDDGSTDGTRDILRNLENRYKIIYHEKNQGKGMALRNGFSRASGDIILIQDADLEGDPRNYPVLIAPILEGKAKVVYGSRFLEKKFQHFSSWFSLGNKFLTHFSNLLTGLKLTDVWTEYKVFRGDVIKEILPSLTSKRFEIELELTAEIAKKKYQIYEIKRTFFSPLRTHREGKKIKWQDGVSALWYIIKFNLLK